MKIILKSTICALILGSLTAYGEGAKPDADGFIHDWLMLAPIKLDQENAGGELIEKDQVDKEAALKPKEGDKAKAGDKELTWKVVKGDKEGILDFNEVLGTREDNVAGYIVAYINTEKELKDVNLLIGNNDQARVYLNGKEIFTYTSTTSLEKDSSKVENLTLNKGVNTIVFKVINENNNWQGCLRFTDKDGKPVTDYTVQTAP